VSLPIVLIDRRRSWERDRTWCTWAVRGTRFTELADQRWHRWRMVAGGREATTGSARHPYLRLDADAVYSAALGRLASAPNVELRSGETVLEIVDGDERPVVRTSRETIDAAEVFDARGMGSPGAHDSPGAPGPEDRARGVPAALAQRFLGWEVETDRPVFDPGVATLMDFTDVVAGDLRFLYVLPYSRTEALLEDTSIGPRALRSSERRTALESALRERWGAREWRVTYEERGHIPMTSRRFPLHPARHVHAVGVAGGAVRPSSGYAFSRIQAHCSRIARALATGTALPDAIAPRRIEVLDAIFLEALRTRPDRFPQIFLQMAQRISGDTFARFMTDSSTLSDEVRIIAALPKRPFLAAVPGARRRIYTLCTYS
jgi:lycopene beta-cyclase